MKIEWYRLIESRPTKSFSTSMKIYFDIAILVNSRFKIQLKIEEVVYKTSVY